MCRFSYQEKVANVPMLSDMVKRTTDFERDEVGRLQVPWKVGS